MINNSLNLQPGMKESDLHWKIGIQITPHMGILLLIILCSACQSSPSTAFDNPDSPISFWDKQRKGTNHFNVTPSEEWYEAAKSANLTFVRLVFEKWDGVQRDFILGDADHYQGIVERDFQQLKQYLDYADSLGFHIVITPISLPGDRWVQSNDGQKDGRLWTDWTYREQAIQYWTDLATRLKGHPALVGYNLVNEPHPESYHQKHSFWNRDLPEWYQSVKDGPGDLNLFNRQMVEAIRRVDPLMPIIIESGLYATPWAFDYLEPLDDDRIIYSFHMYEPYFYVTKRLNQGRYTYPGTVPIEELGTDFHLNKESLDQFFDPVREWSAKHRIPANRIWVSEFGCDRSLAGAEDYLSDLIDIFNAEGWHWSFYTFREDDGWEAMDYELGKGPVHYTYWEYQENKTMHLHYDSIYGGITDSFWSDFAKEFE